MAEFTRELVKRPVTYSPYIDALVRKPVRPPVGTTFTIRDTLGWGGRKSSPVILVTSDQENAEPNWSRSVDSPTARIAVRNDNLGMSLSRDSVTTLGRFPISTSNEIPGIIFRALPCITFAYATFWRRNPMSRSSSPITVRLLDRVPLSERRGISGYSGHAVRPRCSMVAGS